jgi:hypothetical protein
MIMFNLELNIGDFAYYINNDLVILTYRLNYKGKIVATFFLNYNALNTTVVADLRLMIGNWNDSIS